MTLGQRIRDRRKTLKLGQKELGARVGVSKQTVSRWEQNRDTPQGKNLMALARELKMSVEALTANLDETAVPPTRAWQKATSRALDETDALRVLIEGRLGPILVKIPRPQRMAIMAHLIQQVSLLADMAEAVTRSDAAREAK